MSLKTIKSKIRSIDRTHKVTRAMEAVSAVKMRKGQERALLARPYAAAALSILERLRASFEGGLDPLSREGAGKRTAVLVVTSDKGLAGSLNSALERRVHTFLREQGLAREDVDILALGKKGAEHFESRGFSVSWRAQNDRDDVSLGDMDDLATFLTSHFLDGEYRRVYAIYTSFLSTFEQCPVATQILPLSQEALADVVRNIAPKGAPVPESHANDQTIFEPSPEAVLRELVPHLLKVELYHALLESKASEHSARMVAMKNASEKAQEMGRELTLEFNQERQALITREVSEITGGIEAMAR